MLALVIAAAQEASKNSDGDVIVSVATLVLVGFIFWVFFR